MRLSPRIKSIAEGANPKRRSFHDFANFDVSAGACGTLGTHIGIRRRSPSHSSENKASLVNVTGVLAGHAIGTDQAGILQAAGSGTGTASHIGEFRYLIQATVNPAGNSEGVFLLVFSNGDVIYGSLAGKGPSPPPPPPEPVIVTEQLTITGEPGAFKARAGLSPLIAFST